MRTTTRKLYHRLRSSNLGQKEERTWLGRRENTQDCIADPYAETQKTAFRSRRTEGLGQALKELKEWQREFMMNSRLCFTEGNREMKSTKNIVNGGGAKPECAENQKGDWNVKCAKAPHQFGVMEGNRDIGAKTYWKSFFGRNRRIVLTIPVFDVGPY